MVSRQRDAWIEAIKATLERARALNVLYERETLTTRLLMREKICVEGAAYKERLYDWGRRKPKMVREDSELILVNNFQSNSERSLLCFLFPFCACVCACDGRALFGASFDTDASLFVLRALVP